MPVTKKPIKSSSRTKSKPKSTVKKVLKTKPKSKSNLPKVKLKNQPVLIRRSVMYVFVSSLYLFLFVNVMPAVVASLSQSTEVSSQVLGDDDEADEQENESEDGNDREDEQEDEDKDEDEAKEEAEKEAREKEREAAKKQAELSKKNTSGSSKSKSVTVTISPQGIKTLTETETEGSKIKTETKTYDASGKKIGESKLEDQENETEIKAKTFGTTGVESSYQFKDKNGSVVMLKIREGDNSWSKLLYNEKNGMLLVRQKGSPTVTPVITAQVTPSTTVSLTPNPTTDVTPQISPEVTINVTPEVTPSPVDGVETLAIKINRGSFDLISGGISANTTLPVEVDGEEGKVFVDSTEVVVNPDEVAEEATNTQGVDAIESVSLTKENGVTVYKVTGLDSQKFLGLFDVTLPKTLYYSVDTNTLISDSKTAVQNLLDAFSF